MTHHRIISADGTELAVQDIGPRGAPVILFQHGWSQSHLSFARQFALADQFRLILPDLRGHGMSDKPEAFTSYDNSRPWAEDIRAIITALDLHQVTLVGWSMGGWGALDYLEHFGGDRLAGLIFVGSSITRGTDLGAEVNEIRHHPDVKATAMYGEDLGENLIATEKFLRRCFHQQPNADDFAQMMGFNMMVPPAIRFACRMRMKDHRPSLAPVTCPIQIAWGQQEGIVPKPMQQEFLDCNPRAKPMIYAHSGHAPFWEEHELFNQNLAAFVLNATGSESEVA